MDKQLLIISVSSGVGLMAYLFFILPQTRSG
jgi:hypothetical protein